MPTVPMAKLPTHCERLSYMNMGLWIMDVIKGVGLVEFGAFSSVNADIRKELVRSVEAGLLLGGNQLPCSYRPFSKKTRFQNTSIL